MVAEVQATEVLVVLARTARLAETLTEAQTFQRLCKEALQGKLPLQVEVVAVR